MQKKPKINDYIVRALAGYLDSDQYEDLLADFDINTENMSDEEIDAAVDKILEDYDWLHEDCIDTDLEKGYQCWILYFSYQGELWSVEYTEAYDTYPEVDADTLRPAKSHQETITKYEVDYEN